MFLVYFNALSLGEKNTFENIFHRYKNYMFAIALNYVKNTSDAEDIVQDACIRIMKNLSKIDNVDSVETKGFISIITRNVAIDRYHKNKKEIPVDEDWPFVTEDLSDVAVVDKETLKYYLDMLKDKYKNVLIFTYVYDYDDNTIASLFNTSKVNVRKIRSRALTQIRKYMIEGDDFYEEKP